LNQYSKTTGFKAEKHIHPYIAEIGSGEFLSTIQQTLNIVTLAYENITREGLIRDQNETIKGHLMIVVTTCSHDPEVAESAGLLIRTVRQ
jgi:hypothetical protein